MSNSSDDSFGSIDSPKHCALDATNAAESDSVGIVAAAASSMADSASIAQRDDLLEYGRHDIANRLAQTEALESHRETELLRLQSGNRKLLASIKVLEGEVQHWKTGFQEAREQAEAHLQAEHLRWKQQVIDMEKSKGDTERRYESSQDEVSNMRAQLLDVRTRNDDLVGKTRVQERLLDDYKLEVQKSKTGAEDDMYIQSLRSKVSERDCTISEWKERCAKAEGELQQTRSNVLVLNQQTQILEEEKTRYEREVTNWEARRKSGGIIDASQLAQQHNDREQLREELSMVHATNARLVSIMRQSKELNSFIRTLPEDATSFYFCGPTTEANEANPSPLMLMLTAGGGGHHDPSAQCHKIDSLRLSLEAHNISGRSRHLAGKTGHEEKLNAAGGVPIHQQREKDYWIPKEVFAKAGEFRAAVQASTSGSSATALMSAGGVLSDEGFYSFLVDLNRIWYERMKNRNYAASSGGCGPPGTNSTNVGGSSGTGKNGTRCTSCQRLSERKESGGGRQLTTLQAQLTILRRESHAVAAKNVSAQKVLGMYDRLCETAVAEKNKAENSNKKLREEIQSMLSSRDPHIIELKNTLWKLVSDTQRTGTRLTTQLGHLLVEYERTVDMMQLTDSFRAFFSSFSQTVREVMNAEVDMLKQCATEAGSRHDEVCHYQVPEKIEGQQLQAQAVHRGRSSGGGARRADPAPASGGGSCFQPSRYY